MKISKFEAKNFKGLSHSAVFPGQLNILTGPNGTGKTSFLEAVRSAITGKLPEDALKTGTANGFVMADITGLGPVQRTFGAGSVNKTLMCGKTATAKAVGETLQTLYGSKDTMNLMCSSEVMVSMMGNEMSSYLLNEGFLQNDMTVDRLLDMCDLSPKAREELRMMLPVAPNVISLADIQDAYDEYFEFRKEKKRELKEAEAASKYEGVIPTRTLEEVNAEQENVATEIGKLKTAEASYQSLQKAYLTHQDNMRAFQEKLDQFADIKMPDKAETELLEGQVKANDDMIREVSASITTCTADIVNAKKILNALNRPVCPISERLVCSTDKTGIRTELEEQLQAKETLLSNQKEKMGKLRAQQEDLKNCKANHLKRTSDYQTKLMYLERLEKERAVNIPEPQKPVVGQLVTLEARAAALREELALIVRYSATFEAKERVPALTEQVALYEELVDQLSTTGGVRKKVLEHSVAPLQAYCNEKMQELCPKYNVLFDVSAGFKVLLVDESGEPISFSSASSGERLRVIYVLMAMFNAMNQFRILILDNLDDLDDESCEMLLGLIKNDMDDYDHIFLASRDSNLRSAADKLGLRYVDVLNSKTA